MNRRLDTLLVKNHPLLFADRYSPMDRTAMCWGFDCGNGWYKLIKEAADALEPLIKAAIEKDPEAGSLGFFRASQIKEKYGTLRFYLSGGTNEMYAITDKAQSQSSKTCETCGHPGKLRGQGWFYTACWRHARRS